ncbi:MAG: PAS domain S-box protein [Chlorobium sp.]|nr:MAG: PAS domain S-box protein [Chlorobium sp.]
MAQKVHSNNLQTPVGLCSLAEEGTKKHIATSRSRLSTTSSPEEMLRLVHELEAHKIKLEMQEQELARTRHELEDSINMYAELYDFAPVGYLTLGRDSKIQQANLTAAKLLGVDRSRLLGVKFTQFVVPDDYRVIDTLLETVLTRRSPAICEVKLLAGVSQGSRIHPGHFSRKIRIEAGVSDTSHECRIIFSDITALKVAEEGLLKSERNFLSLTEQMADEVFVINSGGTLSYVSPVVEQLFGYLPPEVIGHSFTDYMQEEDRNCALKVFNNTLQHKTTNQTFEVRLKRKDGSLFDGEIRMQYYQDQKISGVIGLIRDVTDRNQAEKALKESERMFRKLFENHSAVMFVIDPYTADVLDANQAAADFYGWSVEELKQMNFQQVADVPMQVLNSHFKKIIASEQKRFVLGHKKKDGSLCDVEVFSNLIEIEEKQILYSIIHDITENKRAAEESDRLKSAFICNISHEIRTPMNGIMGFSELLKNPHLTGEEQTQYLGIIQQSGERMLTLIDDLMDISKIDAKEVKLQITETPLNQLLRDLLALFKQESDKKGLRLSLTIALSDEQSIIDTDSLKLKQVLTNLIQNAMKFTSKGGIDFGYTVESNLLEFYVIDSGIGIPAGKKEKMFERFHQADNSLTRNHEGSGLGLSISKAFVEMMGGTIKVESVEGAGSNFSFTMPYHPVRKHEIVEHTAVDTALAKPALCILIAEDDATSTLLLQSILKGQNITILFAENGWEAVELVQHHPEINLVLMDIKMPVMNGYEATRLIKQHRPLLPVIAQSAFTAIEEKQKAKEAGCDSFLTKPINSSDLLEHLQALLSW